MNVNFNFVTNNNFNEDHISFETWLIPLNDDVDKIEKCSNIFVPISNFLIDSFYEEKK